MEYLESLGQSGAFILASLVLVVLDGYGLGPLAIRRLDGRDIRRGCDDEDAPASQIGDDGHLSGGVRLRGRAALNGICRETGKQSPALRDRRYPASGLRIGRPATILLPN
jgi:hypothetical protein